MVSRHAGVARAGTELPPREGEQVFEEHLAGSGGDSVWVRVSSLGPLAERGEQRAMAYVLFISRPDVETVDHDEVRRLRKSLQLLADTQTDYVVEVDREAMMSFVSPSFCRALGASERELIGKPFAGVLAADQAGVAAAIGQALRPPFAAEMQARLAAGARCDSELAARRRHRRRRRRPRHRGAARKGRAGGALERPRPVRLRPPPRRSTRRLAPIARALEMLEPGDLAGIEALARAVGDAAGAECVSYSVRRGDAVEKALGWRLPPS